MGAFGKESRRERFVRVAPRRVNKIINLLGVLGNCSNKQNYDYTDEDVEQIFGALERRLEEVQAMFLPDAKKRKKKMFHLRENPIENLAESQDN